MKASFPFPSSLVIMKFAYQARSKEGKVQTGTIEASSPEAAAALLQKYNIYVTSIQEVKPQIFSFKKGRLFRKVSKKDLAIFSRQLAVMLDARVPVVQSLSSIAAQISKADFKEKIVNISELIEEGNSLSDAFSAYPKIFDVFYVSLLKSGEASGKISESLYYLSNHLEKEHDIGAKVKGAMVYPILVLIVLVVVVIIIMVMVVPQLNVILKEVGGNIPLSTRIIMGFSSFLLNFGWVILIVFFGLVGFLVYYLRSPAGKKNYDKVSIKLPLVGEFLKKVFLSRFAANVSTLISAGLPVTTALNITKATINNFVYKDILTEAEKEVSEGEKMSSTLARYPEAVPIFVTQMVKVGEDTGKIDKTLLEIVNFYQKEVERGVETFIGLIEPALIIFLAVVVAILAISVMSPLYGMLGAM